MKTQKPTHAERMDSIGAQSMASEGGMAELHQGNMAVRAQRNAERALLLLTGADAVKAVLLVKDWQVVDNPYTFEYMPVYVEMAARYGCHIVAIDRPVEGGIEHLLFMTNIEGLSEQSCLNSLKAAGHSAA